MTQSAKIQYVDNTLTNLTQNKIYEVISWAHGNGIEALILDDTNTIYYALHVEDPLKWSVVHI